MSATDRNNSSASGLNVVPEISPNRSMSCFLHCDSTSTCQDRQSGRGVQAVPLHVVASRNGLHLTKVCIWWPQQQK